MVHPSSDLLLSRVFLHLRLLYFGCKKRMASCCHKWRENPHMDITLAFACMPCCPCIRQRGAGATGRPVIHRSEATMLPSSGCLWICHCGNSIISPVSPPAAPSRPHWNKEEAGETSGLRLSYLTEARMILLWVIWPANNSVLHLSPLRFTTWGRDWCGAIKAIKILFVFRYNLSMSESKFPPLILPFTFFYVNVLSIVAVITATL